MKVLLHYIIVWAALLSPIQVNAQAARVIDKGILQDKMVISEQIRTATFWHSDKEKVGDVVCFELKKKSNIRVYYPAFNNIDINYLHHTVLSEKPSQVEDFWKGKNIYAFDPHISCHVGFEKSKLSYDIIEYLYDCLPEPQIYDIELEAGYHVMGSNLISDLYGSPLTEPFPIIITNFGESVPSKNIFLI